MAEGLDNKDQAPDAGMRTDLAEDRTILANERTFASWIRTGFAGIGIGLAFNALFTRIHPPWVPKLIATVFLLTAMFMFVTAELRARAVLRRMHTHEVASMKLRNIRVIAIASVAATAALLAVMWLLQISPLY